MISKFNKLRKEMELQLTDEIFFTNDDPIQRVNGWFYPSDYDVFQYEVKKYEYYLELNKLYEHILDDDTECKTLPNKRYIQKRWASC